MLTGETLTRHEIDEFRRFFSEDEEWIVQRVIDYATELGYAKYASPVREAWRVAIRGLTESLIAAVERTDGCLDVPADELVSSDPALEFGIREAGLHRSRGVDFGHFLALMKYNEQAFVDYVKECRDDSATRRKYQKVVRRFFDRVEIGFCTEWSGLSAEAAIAELKDRNVRMTGEKDTYLRLFEAVNVPVILLDAEGRVVNMNERTARDFGIEGVDGSGYYSKVGVGQEFTPLAEDVRLFTAGDAPDALFDRSFETTSGRRHYMVRLQRMMDVSNECTNVIVAMADMTQRQHLQEELERQVEERTEELSRANEELVRANHVKNEFLASMSHEFRTPLNSIIGFSSLLTTGLAGPVNDEQTHQLSMISSAGEHLLRLVNDLLDLARIEAGRLQLSLTDFEITDLCKSLMGMMRPLAQDKGVTIECAHGCDAVILHSDRDKVTQILINLVSNAIKFTDHGVVRTSCSTDADAGLVRILVSDTGRGVAEEDLPHIFDEFRRSGSSLSPSDGSGLGLAISQRLAHALGGDIEVESTLGEGSTFTLILPMVSRCEDASMEIIQA